MSKIKILALDIGHNSTFDKGAVGIKNEDDLNLAVSNRILERLKPMNIKVVNCTPPTSSSHRDSLNKRCVLANNSRADFFLSIHHNACPGGYGSEGLCITGGMSENVGRIILEEISKLGFRNRGIKDRRDLYVINNTVMPALIVECAFVDSSRDMNGYDPVSMGDAIFRGLVRAFGLVDSAPSEEFYTVVSGDSLWGISRRFGVSVDWLVSVNGIRDRNLIRTSQKLRVK